MVLRICLKEALFAVVLCFQPDSHAPANPLPGADDANSRFYGGSAAADGAYNYLALRDHPGPTGVPLGGIGAGCVQFAPDGHFTRTSGINNWFTDCATEFRQANTLLENGHFLAIWDRLNDGTTVTRRLQRDGMKTCGLASFDHSIYRGLFPVADVYFADDSWPTPSATSVRTWSGLVPHELADSTVPCFWVEVTIANSHGAKESAIALSWADLLGRGLLEPKDPGTIPIHPFECNQTHFKEVPRPATIGRQTTCQGWNGVVQTITGPFPSPSKLTFQTAVTQVMLLAQPQPDAVVSVLPAYQIEKGASAWEPFAQNGTFDNAGVANLSGPGAPSAASAVAVRVKVPDGGKRTVRFLLAWYAPPVIPDPARSNDPRYRFGNGDYGAWYQNRFSKVEDVAAYAIAGRERVWAGVRAWQDPILNSSLPDWLQFKLINSAYTLYTNTILNRDGDFSVMEGGMGGLAATMDVRNIVHTALSEVLSRFGPSRIADVLSKPRARSLPRREDEQSTLGRGDFPYARQLFRGAGDRDNPRPLHCGCQHGRHLRLHHAGCEGLRADGRQGMA